jgi:hypothetical protein
MEMQPEHRRRPVGIWIATLWCGLLDGLFPLGLVLFFYFGPANGAELMSSFQLALSLALSIGIIGSAVGTWRGSSGARYTLAALVVIYCALLAYQNYQLAAAGVQIRGSTLIPWGRVVREIITAAVIAGYLLLSRSAQDFFKERP